MTLNLKRIISIFASLFILTGTAYADSYLVWGNANWSAKNSKAVTAAGGTIVRQFPQIGMVVVESDNPDFMNSISGVAGVVPDFHVSAPQTMTFAADDLPQPPNTGDDDFFFDLQWGHTSVRAQEAWAAGQTGAGARVFVLDEGFDLTHPDLAPNYNLGLSATFVPLPGENVDASYVLADPFSHGTHVAGTIAAADNAFGTIGVAPDAEIVPVKVLSEVVGSGAFSWIIGGILYAADNGADVINMSLGTIIPQNLKDDGDSVANEIAALRVAVNRAIGYAYRNGATVIVSAGNDGLDLNAPENAALINFNGFASHAVSISAVGPEGWGVDPTTDLNQQAFYTNVGPEVNFAGQGGTIDFDLFFNPGISCTVAGLTRPCYVFDFVFSTGSLNGWYWSIGTSMAAPHAAGVAAIIIGENGGSMHPAQVRAEMAQRALDLGKPGKDDLFGAGLVTTGY
jgi:subtilisin family serine protease